MNLHGASRGSNRGRWVAAPGAELYRYGVAAGRDRGDQQVLPEEDWFAPAPVEDDWFFDGDEPTGEPDEWLAPAGPPPGGRAAAEPGRRLALTLVVVVVGIALLAVGVLLVRALDGDEATVTPPATTPVTTAPLATGPTATEPAATAPATTEASPITVPQDVTLRPGDEGEDVEALQQALAQLDLDPGTIDGDYGVATEEAVTAFQEQAGLDADGVAGPETLAALAAALASG